MRSSSPKARWTISSDPSVSDKLRTGNGPLTGSVFYLLEMPSNMWFIQEIAGLLIAATFEKNWEKVGDITIDEAVSAASDVFGSFQSMVGTVFSVAWNTIPDSFLICDGATYNRVDFPALYAVLDPAFIIDADHFQVPDLRGAVVMGESGTHAIGSSGGEETHTLSMAEMPAHTHTEITAVASFAEIPVAPVPSAIPSIGVTGSAGLGTAHNNLQPFSVLKYVIAAR